MSREPKEEKPSFKKTEHISLPDSITTRLMRGERGSNFDRLNSIFDVEIKLAHRRDEPYRHSIHGEAANVDLVVELLRSTFYDASMIIKKARVADRHSLKEEHFVAFKKSLGSFVTAFAARKGDELRIQRAVERTSKETAKHAVDQMRRAIGSVVTNSAPTAAIHGKEPSSTGHGDLSTPAIPAGRVRDMKVIEYQPRNLSSALLYTALSDELNRVAAGVGPAGGSKTFTSMHWAFNEISQRRFERVAIFRPRETTGKESFGAVKGGMDEKMRPYMKALETNARIITGEGFSQLEARQILMLDTGDFIRGDTLHNTIFLIDEAENFEVGQIKAITTRIGRNSRLIYAGDISAHQSDLQLTESGLVYLVHHYNARAQKSQAMRDGLAMVQFKPEDSAARNEFLPEILASFEETPQGYTRVFDHAIREDEQSRAISIESNRARAVEIMQHQTNITETKYTIQALARWPQSLGADLTNVAILQQAPK